MARIYGVRSMDPSTLRKLEGKAAGLFSPEMRQRSDFHLADGFGFGWAGVGRPPFSYEDEKCVIFGEGNFFSLGAASVANLGEFLSASLRKGVFPSAIAEINGDFSLAAFLKGSKELWLARDRFGLKPLYFSKKGESVAFASLPAAAAALLGFRANPRKAYVARYLAAHYRYFDNEQELSPYDDIFQVAPAQIVRFSGTSIERISYWSLTEKGDLSLPEEELAERYRALLADAVRIRLSANSGTKAFTLSGGMDSSSVMATAVKLLGKKQIAYSSVYEDKTYDESDDIRSMLDANVSEWRTVKIDVPNTFRLIDEMVRVHQEPVVTATWLSHFLLSGQAARQGIQDLFGGLGGDELNAGEYEYFWYFFADLKVEGNDRLLAQEVDAWAKYHDHPVFKKSREIMERTLPRMADLSRPGICLADNERMFKYRKALNPGFYDLAAFHPVMRTPFKSYLKNRCYQDLTVETIPPCLRAEDRHGSYFGTENLLPFLDYRLVELMFQVRGTQKFRSGVTKHLLRQATKTVLPEETRTRVKKTGWNAPAHVWFSGKGREELLDMIGSKQFRERGLYDCAEIERIVHEHEEIVSQGLVKENHMMFLWQLVNLELWLRSAESGR
jgi:asparagine synthase (glutamine-hydrolysing)